MILLPEGLKALKKVAQKVGLALRGAYLNLDAGFDSTHNRQGMFNAGMIPNIKENPRHRKTPKRGRKRFFNATIHALRTRVDRTFAKRVSTSFTLARNDASSPSLYHLEEQQLWCRRPMGRLTSGRSRAIHHDGIRGRQRDQPPLG
jgi:hypothetical protein